VSSPKMSRQRELAMLLFISERMSNIHFVTRRTFLTASSFGSPHVTTMRIRS
jgi:hypothetical protein